MKAVAFVKVCKLLLLLLSLLLLLLLLLLYNKTGLHIVGVYYKRNNKTVAYSSQGSHIGQLDFCN